MYLKNMIKLSAAFALSFFFSVSTVAMTAKEMAERTVINLSWIFKSKSDSNGDFVFPIIFNRQTSLLKGTYEEIDLFKKVEDWAQRNPETQINIWCDLSLVRPGALDNTMARFAELGIASQIKIIDINEELSRYKDLLSPTLGVYFRTDIVRILATHATLQKIPANEILFFAYFDLAIDAINLVDLYEGAASDKNITADLINKYGIVVGKSHHEDPYENSFHIMSNRENLLFALENAIIKKNQYRLVRNAALILRSEGVVWHDFRGFIQLFHALEGNAEIAMAAHKRMPALSRESLLAFSIDEELALFQSSPSQIGDFGAISCDYSYFPSADLLETLPGEYLYSYYEYGRKVFGRKASPLTMPTRQGISKITKNSK